MPPSVAKTIEKAFNKDPQAKRRDYKGQTIWEITQEESAGRRNRDDDRRRRVCEHGGGRRSRRRKRKKRKSELPNMAITVYLDHLIVSTHVDFVQEFIAHQANTTAKLGQAARLSASDAALDELGSDERQLPVLQPHR